MPAPVFSDPKHHITIYQGDCLEILAAMPEGCVDLIFADPPYFLSNDGITCHAGKMVSVNKGAWDRPSALLGALSLPNGSPVAETIHEFNRAWVPACHAAIGAWYGHPRAAGNIPRHDVAKCSSNLEGRNVSSKKKGNP